MNLFLSSLLFPLNSHCIVEIPSIEYFMTNVDVEVFLVSLKADGVALNLTEASRVFIVDL
jgi:hypothetical protein